MSQGCRGVYATEIRDLRELRHLCRDALREAGFTYDPRRITDRRFRIHGRTSSGLLSDFLVLVPFLGALVTSGNVHSIIEARCVKDELGLFVFVGPRGELPRDSDDVATGAHHISDIGRNRKAREHFDALIAALESRGVIAATVGEECAVVGFFGSRIVRETDL